jgi:cell division transport system permease protein
MRWRFFLSEAVHSIRGNVSTTLAAVLTVLVVTFLMGFILSLGVWAYKYTVGVRNEVTVKAYISQATGKNATTRSQIANEIGRMPYVKSFEYVSPADALLRVSPGERKSVQALGFNPYPPSFWIKLTDPSKASQLVTELGGIPDIKNCGGPGACITYGQKVADKVLTMTKWFLLGLGIVMALLGVAAVILIQNTIRLSIFARRREIEVMKLVGATNAFVRLPFVLEGMITGLLGAVAALGLLGIVYAALDNYHRALTDPARSVGVLVLIALLCSFGLVLGAFSSALTLRRFLRV